LESLPIRADVEGESVEDWCERQDVALVIDASLRFLPLFQRAAFLLHYWERMSLADTARVLSCSPRRARVASAHACRTLSVILLQKGVSI
jgi:DNA-directed RNA polymerase specialized sigma24 family protein